MMTFGWFVAAVHRKWWRLAAGHLSQCPQHRPIGRSSLGGQIVVRL